MYKLDEILYLGENVHILDNTGDIYYDHFLDPSPDLPLESSFQLDEYLREIFTPAP